MPKRNDGAVAPEVTGGKGFGFEDEVAAFYMVCLLAGAGLDGNRAASDGQIIRIACQQGHLGWQPDDVVLTLREAADGERRCAVSLKNYAVLNGHGFADKPSAKGTSKEGFGEQAWRLYLGRCAVDPPFDQERDLVGLVGQHLAAVHQKSWQFIADRVAKQAPSSVRSGLSKKQVTMFDGCACPPSVCQDSSRDAEATARFLRCVRVFDLAEYRGRALLLCQDLLLSADHSEAEQMWDTCCRIAARYRPEAGTLDLAVIVAELRGHFALRPFPDYRAELDRLGAVSRILTGEIDDTIDGLTLTTDASLAQITSLFSADSVRVVAIIGPSGAGKTVVAKRWAEAQPSDGTVRVVWWDNATLSAVGPTAFAGSLDLPHGLQEVLPAIPEQKGFLVIDGIDRLFRHEEMDNLGRLLSAARLSDDSSPWRLVTTCESETWGTGQAPWRQLLTDYSCETVTVALPEVDDVTTLVSKHEALRPLVLSERLKGFILRPKVLALLVSLIKSGQEPDASLPLGQTQVINWLWFRLVDQDDCARTGVALTLATKQADELLQLVPLTDFDVEQQRLLAQLVREHVCAAREQRYGFAHDLYSEWPRLQVLIANQERLPVYLEARLSSPLWQRALRLYGTYLLERDQSVAQWQALFGSLGGSSQDVSVGQLALLDSLFGSTAARQQLPLLWPTLIQDDGNILRLLLQRLLHVGTAPDERLIVELGLGSDGDSAEFRSLVRQPDWAAWGRLLPVVVDHSSDVVRYAPDETASMASIFLRYTRSGFPYRRELATMAIAAARAVASDINGSLMATGRSIRPQMAYLAALMAAEELPNEVAGFALEMCRRANVPERLLREEHDLLLEEDSIPPFRPDGPLARVDEAFRQACLEQGGATLLVRNTPDVACEVVLALLILPPRTEYGGSLDETSIASVPLWYPPLPRRGPFREFLRLSPEIGIDLIVRLANFATETSPLFRTREGAIVGVDISGWGQWLGDRRAFYWHRGEFGQPEVASALMALEEWLYDLLDAGQSVSSWIEMIAHRSQSVALAGVLAAVACREPHLVKAELAPLLFVPEFLVWERQHSVQSGGHLNPLLLQLQRVLRGEALPQELEQWHLLPHRQTNLHEVALRLLIFEPDMHPTFEAIADQWIDRAEELPLEHPARGTIARLAEEFRPSNWRLERAEDGTEYGIYVPPAELQQEACDALVELRPEWLLLTIPMRCQQLVEEGSVLSPEAADELWQQVHELRGLTDSGASSEAGPISLDDAVCGVAATLVLLADEWLGEHAERREWCTNTIIGACQSPTVKRFIPEEVFDCAWDMFCAHALPTVWARSPGDVATRQAAGVLALSPHPQTVATLLARCFPHRQALSDDFGRLRHIVLLAARARHLEQEQAWHDEQRQWQQEMATPQATGETGQGERFSMEDWTAKHLALFMSGTISPVSPSVTDMAVWRESRVRDRHYRSRREFGLHPSWMEAAFDWLPADLNDALDAAERSEWLALWIDLVTLVATTVTPQADEERDLDVEGTPIGLDEWVFDRVGIVLMTVDSALDRKRLWQPLLDLGPSARYWVGRFASSFLIFGRSRAGATAPAFITVWREMIEHALTYSAWQERQGRMNYALADMWSHLLGMTGAMMWRDEEAPAISQMRDLFQRWTADHLWARPAQGEFVWFLQLGAARPLRMDAIVSLAKIMGDGQADLDHLGDEFAKVVALCWREQRLEIMLNENTKQAFLVLLDALKHNPIVAQVAEEVGRF